MSSAHGRWISRLSFNKTARAQIEPGPKGLDVLSALACEDNDGFSYDWGTQRMIEPSFVSSGFCSMIVRFGGRGPSGKDAAG